MNNLTRWNKRWGGVIRCFESKPTLLVGGFKFALNELPESGNVLPAGSPVYCDEVNRTIAPLYLFKVTKVESGSKKITVAKGMEGTRVKVGMTLIMLGDNLDAAATTNMTVAAVDSTADDVDVITVDAVETGLTEGKVIAQSNAERKVKVVPNALTPYDTCVDEDAFACDGEGAWACYDTPVLENRIPVLPKVIKDALRDAGCYFRFSNRK